MRPARLREAGGLAALVALLAAPGLAAADEGEADGVYGRLDGDLLVVAEAGAAIAEGGPAVLMGARALYLSTAGIYGRWIEGFDRAELVTGRSVAVGVELRPMFLARLAQDWERGPAHLDLLLDSFALDLGAFFWSPVDGRLHTYPGFEVGAGLEVPVLPSATGPRVGVMGSLRVSHGDVGAPAVPGRAAHDELDARSSAVLVTLSWHHVLDAGIVDAGDALTR